jgi:hypothetical protein
MLSPYHAERRRMRVAPSKPTAATIARAKLDGSGARGQEPEAVGGIKSAREGAD